MAKILISACLMGFNVRYDGKNQGQQQQDLKQIINDNEVIHFCPEVAGGLPIPRAPAEIQGQDAHAVLQGNAKVLDNTGTDVTKQFVKGAHLTLQRCLQDNIHYAILMERSPSCGSELIYDGSFSGTKISGQGITTALLRKHGIQVFHQNNLSQLQQMLNSEN